MKARAFAALGLAFAFAKAAEAAGGHYDVDDATVLEPGHCLVETWATQGRQPTLATRHLGAACRAGAAEWGLDADRLRSDGDRTETFGPQVKWVADPIARRLSVGGALALAWHAEGPRRPLASVWFPATLWLGKDGELQLHANLGHDRDPLAGSARRWGVAADWTVNDALTLTAERRTVYGQALSRLGLRWSFTPFVSVDVSGAAGGAARVLALGLNWEWQR